MNEDTKEYYFSKADTIKNIIADLEDMGIAKRYIGAISLQEKYKWFSKNEEYFGIVNEIEIEVYNLKFAEKIRKEYTHPAGKINVIYRGDISTTNITRPGSSAWCKWDKKERDDYIEWMNAVNSLNC